MAKKRANGEGNIRKRKDGHWEGRYTTGYESKTGKRIIGRTQAEVKEKLKRALEETNGLDVSRAADEYTVASWLRTWYELYAKPSVRTATANRYQLIIEQYTVPRIGSIKLKRPTTRHLQKLYKELLESGRIHVGKKQGKGLSTTTVHSVHLMLHAVLDRAVKERLIPETPARTASSQRPGSLLSPEQMGPTWKPHSGGACYQCSIWNWSAVCGRGNWWPCGGTIWIFSSGRSPLLSNMSATRTVLWK